MDAVDAHNNPGKGAETLRKAGLAEKVPTIRIPTKTPPEAYQGGKAAAQRTANVAARRIGMLKTGGLAGAGIALAPGVGGALGYGAGALQNGDPVGPAMKEGFKAGYGMVGDWVK